MKLNVHNSHHRAKAFPGMPGVTHMVKAGKTIQVDMPDNMTRADYQRLAAHGLTFSTIEDAVAAEPPKPAPTPAKEEKPASPKAKKESQPDTASKEAVAEAPAPLPWQKGLEPPQ